MKREGEVKKNEQESISCWNCFCNGRYAVFDDTSISGNINYLNDQQANWHLDETVTIYTDSTKTTVWGTLEMLSRSHDYLISSLGVVVGTFVGHGTGALEGVKVQGDVLVMRIAGVSTRIREGIAVG